MTSAESDPPMSGRAAVELLSSVELAWSAETLLCVSPEPVSAERDSAPNRPRTAKPTITSARIATIEIMVRPERLPEAAAAVGSSVCLSICHIFAEEVQILLNTHLDVSTQ